jgi:hypothetical protein
MPHLYEAWRDISELALGTRSCRLLASGSDASAFFADQPQSWGGIVQLNAGDVSVHVGVMAKPEDCPALTKSLLGERAGEAPKIAVVRGAMCELAYLLAGGVRRRLATFGDVSVGQPSFIEGRFETRAGWRLHESYVELDGIALTLMCATRSDAAFAAVSQRPLA